MSVGSVLARPDGGGLPSPARRSGLRRILCPVDLSDVSRGALGFALMLARQHGAQVRVTHVVRPDPVARVPAADLESARRRLLSLASSASLSPGDLDVLLDEGDPVESLLRRAAEWPADLLVMGTHGQGWPRSWGLGSVADAVVRRAAGPVLAVPPGAADAGPRPFQRVLAAVDFSEPARRMLDEAARLVDPSTLQLTLLHVVEWFPGGGGVTDLCVPEYQLDLAGVTRDRLRRAMERSALAGPPPQFEVAAGVPHREILRVAGQVGAELIALGLHGRRALDRQLPGSTISHLLREATCPVLAVSA